MAKPWIKKNPLTSLSLGGAHLAPERARGATKAMAPRPQTQLTRKAVRAWTDILLAPAKPKKKRPS